MTYGIGAAGTGGHVYPALAVAEALVAGGVVRSDITFFGGDRLEKEVFPAEGFPFVEVELRGLRRSLTLRNVTLPWAVLSARRRIEAECSEREVKVALGTGSYVTIPLGWAAMRIGVPFFVQEQNADPGLANTVMSRRAEASFVSFSSTRLPRSVHVGNPVRAALADFSRSTLRKPSLDRYGLEDGPFTVGIVGGSLGALVLNESVVDLATGWKGPSMQLLHLCGPAHVKAMEEASAGARLPWRVLGFEPRMERFFAACDVVVARGGGMVAEILATATPAILVPGGFGSGGHQDSNAHEAHRAGAAIVVQEDELERLPGMLETLMSEPDRLVSMQEAAARLAKPHAATRIAAILMGRHG